MLCTNISKYDVSICKFYDTYIYAPLVLAQGEISTQSGSTTSVADASSTPGEDDMDQLEKEVEKAVAQMMIKEPSTTPPKHPSQVPETAPKAAAASPPPAHTAPVPGSATVTGNLASGLGPDDEGLLPSAIYDTKVDETVRATIGKMDEQQFATAVENAKNHPEFAGYVKGVRLESGLDEVEWEFGEEEPEEDLVGFYVWIHGKSSLRKRLGLEGGGGSLGKLEQLQHPSMGGTLSNQAQATTVATKGVEHPSLAMGSTPIVLQQGAQPSTTTSRSRSSCSPSSSHSCTAQATSNSPCRDMHSHGASDSSRSSTCAINS